MARREYQDPSILTRMTPRGEVYYVRYRVKRLGEDGRIVRREKWHELGLCSHMTANQAKRAKDKILREVNAEVYTFQSQMKWTAFVAVFDQNHIVKKAVPTQNNYRQQLSTHITPAWRKMRLCDLGPLQVEQFFSLLEKAGVAHSTRNTIRGVLAAAFGCAVKWRLIQTSPMSDGISGGGGPRRVRERRIPSLDQVQRLIAVCSGDVPLLIEALCSTGLRISEAAGLLVRDLKFDSGLIEVRRRNCRGDVGDTKSESGVRDLPMGLLQEALRLHVAGKDADAPVFTHDGEPIVDNTLLANYLTPRMVKLGIKFPGFGWHTFRRLHLSLMQTRGLTLFDLRRQAGHASVRTTQEYVMDDIQRRAAAVAELPRLRLVKGA
ncbi:MAG TPA: site-specific integrase [Candidatus Limnocylindrales bacterium]|nr:site-specific integrase [Candidatus Limnocylindrales bacterium]